MKAPRIFAVHLAPKQLLTFLLALAVPGSQPLTLAAGYPNNINDSEDEYALKFGLPGAPGVATWKVSEPYINLWLFQEALTYHTSYGQTVDFGLAFKQRNDRCQSDGVGFGSSWEHSWLSYVTYSYGASTNLIVGPTFIGLGGQRSYVADGLTKEFKSSSTMSTLTNGLGELVGFQIRLPSGGALVYSTAGTECGQNCMYLTEEIEPTGRTHSYAYDTANGYTRLRTRTDPDGNVSHVYYDNTHVWRISSVCDPYWHCAAFYYDTNSPSRLTGIVNSEGMTSSFQYDTLGLVTNMVTIYGTNSFKATTNAFAPYNLGGTNQVNRSLEVTEPNGDKHLFIYRDQSTKLNPLSSTDLLPASYPVEDVPNTLALSNAFDNVSIDARNSFYWNKQQYAALSAGFRSSGEFNQLTTNDYNIAQVKHWLRVATGASLVTETLSHSRAASANGIVEGQKVWMDYSGKTSGASSRGTNSQPSFVALVLPDNTTRFSYTERSNVWERPTRVISTFTSGSGFGTRTNTLVYTGDGIDMVQLHGPNSELLSSNAYNNYHQIITNYNAIGEMTVYGWDATRRLTNILWPSGLETRLTYYQQGYGAGWLDDIVNADAASGAALQSSSFTWAAGSLTHMKDVLGLDRYYVSDSLWRLLKTIYPVGTETNQYYRLELLNQISVSGTLTNQYIYDAMRQLRVAFDPKRGSNQVGFTGGLITSITNALGQTNKFTYDLNGNTTSITHHDESVQTFNFNRLGELTSRIDAAGVAITNWYANHGLLMSVSNAFGAVSHSVYDNRDRLTNLIDANGVSVSMTYDNLNRLVTRTYPDGGTEGFRYSARGLVAYTNQLGKVTLYDYDPLGRKIAETNANGGVTRYVYDPAGNLIKLIDARGKTNEWLYDLYGRASYWLPPAGGGVFYYYDSDGRLTNRLTAAHQTGYVRDANGNVTVVNSSTGDPVVFFAYDALNRVTNMVDAAGTTRFTYTSFGALESEDGPWDNDTISYSYKTNHLRSSLTISAPNSSPWVQTYSYDAANRLLALTSPAGSFSYAYNGPGLLRSKLTFPTGAYVTNSYDTVARVTSSALMSSVHAVVNSHSYAVNVGGQRTQQTRTDGSYVEYTYDDIGQLRSASGKEFGSAITRVHEQLGYLYDAAGNLNQRTNNGFVETFNVNDGNMLTSVNRAASPFTVVGTTSSAATNVTVNSQTATRYADNTFVATGFTLADGTNTFTAIAQDNLGRSDTNVATAFLPDTVNYTYTVNGEILTNSTCSFGHDADGQLRVMEKPNFWKTQFVYDGLHRLRIRKEFTYTTIGGLTGYYSTNEVRHVYDGRLPIQERDQNNLPTVTYTRGVDLSGTFDGAGGIGGLLARTENSVILTQTDGASTFYHADANGNITMLIDDRQLPVAKYLYDPFGRTIALTGPLAHANTYRFSSKEYHDKSGFYYFGRRFYDPNLQRWPNRDPSGMKDGPNLYGYVHNGPVNAFDSWGQEAGYFYHPDGGMSLRIFEDRDGKIAEWIMQQSSMLLPSLVKLDAMTGGPEYRAVLDTYFSWTQQNRASLPPFIQSLLTVLDETGGIGIGVPVGVVKVKPSAVRPPTPGADPIRKAITGFKTQDSLRLLNELKATTSDDMLHGFIQNGKVSLFPVNEFGHKGIVSSGAITLTPDLRAFSVIKYEGRTSLAPFSEYNPGNGHLDTLLEAQVREILGL